MVFSYHKMDNVYFNQKIKTCPSLFSLVFARKINHKKQKMEVSEIRKERETINFKTMSGITGSKSCISKLSRG